MAALITPDMTIKALMRKVKMLEKLVAVQKLKYTKKINELENENMELKLANLTLAAKPKTAKPKKAKPVSLVDRAIQLFENNGNQEMSEADIMTKLGKPGKRLRLGKKRHLFINIRKGHWRLKREGEEEKTALEWAMDVFTKNSNEPLGTKELIDAINAISPTKFSGPALPFQKDAAIVSDLFERPGYGLWSLKEKEKTGEPKKTKPRSLVDRAIQLFENNGNQEMSEADIMTTLGKPGKRLHFGNAESRKRHLFINTRKGFWRLKREGEEEKTHVEWAIEVFTRNNNALLNSYELRKEMDAISTKDVRVIYGYSDSSYYDPPFKPSKWPEIFERRFYLSGYLGTDYTQRSCWRIKEKVFQEKTANQIYQKIKATHKKRGPKKKKG